MVLPCEAVIIITSKINWIAVVLQASRSCLLLLLIAAPGLQAAHDHLEEILVTARKDTREFELAKRMDIEADSGKLLRRAPGANLNSNGPLTGIAQYRGMYGNRIATHIDGTTLSSGGPNWMDPPLSYAPAAILDSLIVYRGIAPVSAGQETIGGAINATTWNGEFSDNGLKFNGHMRGGAQTVNDGYLLSGLATVANESHRLKVSAFTEDGNNAEFGNGKIRPSKYERTRFDIGYGFRSGDHTLQLDYGRNDTGDSGTAALPMDIQYIDSDLFRLNYDFHSNRFAINAKVYYSEIDHGMSNFHLRTAPANGAMWRRNIATGDNIGFSLVADYNNWKLGVDGHQETHNSDIDNPNNSMFFVDNFNDAERRVIGVFAEREQSFGDSFLFELGLRYNNVHMEADEVNGTPALLMPPATALRNNFNSSDRSRTDNNIDWVAKMYYQASSDARFYAALSRKSRSPSYQERFLWLPLEATAGLADMRTYTGNLDLEEEIAHEIELGVDWNGDKLTVSPRFFYRKVDDYIQGTVSTDSSAVMFVNMMNMMNGMNRPAPLQFNNVDANIYGFDTDWRYNINNNWALDGVLSYVRGERDDIDDNLYRISPLNAHVAVNYSSGSWGVRVETRLVSEQDKISQTNGEQTSDGYALLNIQAYWNINKAARLGLSAENVTDKDYRDHLGGYNRVMGNPDIAAGERLPGYGRNISLRAEYNW